MMEKTPEFSTAVISEPPPYHFVEYLITCHGREVRTSALETAKCLAPTRPLFLFLFLFLFVVQSASV